MDGCFVLVTLPVAGVRHHCRRDLVRSLVGGQRLFLEREPDNQFDSSAVRVDVSIGGEARKVGYVPATVSQMFARLIDNGYEVLAEVDEADEGTMTVDMRLMLREIV